MVIHSTIYNNIAVVGKICVCMCVTSRCVRRSHMSACGNNNTTGVSLYIRRYIMFGKIKINADNMEL